MIKALHTFRSIFRNRIDLCRGCIVCTHVEMDGICNCSEQMTNRLSNVLPTNSNLGTHPGLANFNKWCITASMTYFSFTAGLSVVFKNTVRPRCLAFKYIVPLGRFLMVAFEMSISRYWDVFFCSMTTSDANLSNSECAIAYSDTVWFVWKFEMKSRCPLNVA